MGHGIGKIREKIGKRRAKIVLQTGREKWVKTEVKGHGIGKVGEMGKRRRAKVQIGRGKWVKIGSRSTE